jgi:hypothetical protein
MIRWTDLIGFAGLAMTVLGTLLLFPGSIDRMDWKYLLAGLAFWVAGFASMVGWLLLRWSARRPREGSPTSYDKAA